MKTPDKVSSISAMHQFLGLKKPSNPLISVFNFDDVKLEPETVLPAVTTDFYVVALKKDCAGGKCKYGQQYYDFDEGIMYFIAPHQVLQFEDVLLNSVKGFVLVIHPDFFQGYPLASKIKDYGFFSYAASEALYLSEKEEKSVMDIIDNVEQEIDANMDSFTQDLLVSNLDLLLKYCDRFYNRQFLTRKKVNSDLLSKLEGLLDDYFRNDQLILEGIPTVHFVAEKLNLSPNYLSDMLRVQTGQTTQQHIQNRLIEKAKELLSTTEMSVSEIAYHLGFEHPQSFHRLFKNRTSLSPLELEHHLIERVSIQNNKSMSTLKILIIATNVSMYANCHLRTGLWLSELTHIYHAAKEKGYDITIASPKGGNVPIDPESLKPFVLDKISTMYWNDVSFRELLNNSRSLSEVDEVQYDLVYLAGGHGTMYDFPDDTMIQSIIKKQYESGKMVSAICHGVGGLLNVRLSNGEYLIKGKTMTGFDWFEETIARRKKAVPFNLEAAIKERDAHLKKAFIPMTSNVVVDGNLITGQNPFSSKEMAKVVIKQLDKL